MEDTVRGRRALFEAKVAAEMLRQAKKVPNEFVCGLVQKWMKPFMSVAISRDSSRVCSFPRFARSPYT